MPDSAGPSLFWAPFVAFGVVGVLALILRWAWSGRKDSLLSTPARSGAEGDYGLLVPVAVPRDAQDGQRLAQQLDEHGVRDRFGETRNLDPAVHRAAFPRATVPADDEPRRSTAGACSAICTSSFSCSTCIW